jgi:hypothetical protein
MEDAGRGQAFRNPRLASEGSRLANQPRPLEAAGLGRDPLEVDRERGDPCPGGSPAEPALKTPALPPVIGQQHDPHLISQAVRGVIDCWSSLRGACGWLALTMGKVVSHETIRNWLHRLGYYVLHRPIERRDDWVLFIDHTMVLGSSRCLLVLGTSLRRWQAKNGALAHTDMQVLMVEVVTTSNGAVVNDQLRRLIDRIGVPAQIVSDHGGDLTKGIELLGQLYPQVVDTYDVSHKLACLLKAELEPDPRWHEFIRRAGVTRAFLQQAVGGVPRPPALRTKARYQNLEPLVAWGRDILRLDDPGLDDRLARQRATTPARARHWFDQKVGWVSGFARDLARWQGLLSIVEQTRRQIREDGLHAGSVALLKRRLAPLDRRGRPFAKRVIKFIASQCQRVPSGECYLGCSEVIESIFGKYKSHLERSPSPSLGTNVLLFPLFVTRITPKLVAEALRTVKHRMVECFTQRLGGSSQRRLSLELWPPGRNRKPA